MIPYKDKRGIFLTTYNFLYAPIESQGVNQLKIPMQNQNLQQFLIEKMPRQPIYIEPV